MSFILTGMVLLVPDNILEVAAVSFCMLVSAGHGPYQMAPDQDGLLL